MGKIVTIALFDGRDIPATDLRTLNNLIQRQPQSLSALLQLNPQLP